MQSTRNEIWEQNKKEIDALVFRVQNFPKIVSKIAAELARREKYNSTIE